MIGTQLLSGANRHGTVSLLIAGCRYYHEIVGGHDCHGWGEGADVGVGGKTARKRAVGTREHIIAYLTEVNELFDTNGMASTQLAAAVGYPGSSVAFAQLLSGMQRSGLIEREVRGKRTYRIAAAAGAAAAEQRRAARLPGERLLAQVVRRLAAAPGEAPAAPDRQEGAALEQRVAGLERELASVRTMHGTL